METAAKGDAFSYSEYLSDVVQRSNSSVGDFGVSGAPDYLTTAWYITDTSKTVLHAYSEPFCGGDQPSVVPTSLYSAVPSLHPSGVPSAFQPVSPPVELQSLPATYDMLLHEDMNHIWLEIGYTILNDYEWTDVTTSVQNFNANGDGDKNVSIFIGLPDYGGPTYEDGFPLVPKLRERAERQVDGSFKFSAKLVQANDSFCSKEWYIPEHVENIQVGWMAVEEGVYNVSGSMFVIDSGLITRDNSVPVSEDTPVLYHHVVTFNFTSGCDSLNPDRPCEYAEKLDAESGKTWLHLGALQQIQTSVNTVDNGRDLWLTIRSRNVFTDRIQLMLATHSVDLSLYPSYETVAVPEVAGYFIFERDHHIQCVEGLVFETQISFPVTSEAIEVDFFFTYDYPPGIFGMLGSLNSLGDSTALRVFERTETKAWYITQEDQCFDEETRHTTEERSFAFIAGESRGLEVPQTRCFISYAYSNPTGVPSSHPSLAPTLNNDAVCGACLADGEYIFRSTGACDPYGEGVSWDFCGVRGNVQDEFHFWMEDGVCYPGVFGEACGSLSAHPTSLPSAEPSGVPSCQPSSEPSSQPTILPSSAPTSLPTELGSFDVVPELECQSQCGETQTTNDTCLYVTLWDSFGDGWVNGSTFYYWAQIRGEDTNVVNETLDCGCPVMAGCIHPSELNVDQLFHMTVVALDSEGVAYVPEYAWEVHWTVQVVEDGVWKEKYYGGYNSSFVFEYDRASESYSLESWSNLWTFPEYCNDCVETAAKGDAFSYSEYLSDVVQRSNSSVGDFGVSEAPDYLTTAWYITDTSKTVLHAYSEPFCGGDQPSVVPTSLYTAVPSLHPSGVPSAFQPVSPPVEVQSLPATYDMLLHEDMNHIWLEIGYTILNDYEWTDVTTSVQNFNANGDGDKNVSIFIGLPDYGGPTYEDGFPLVPKLRERAERQVDGSFKFSAKLVQANDSFCSKEWYIPEHVENIQVGWMAVEEGVYNVSGSMFVIDSGLITRDNSVPVSEDTPVLYHHVVTFNFTSGCDSLNPDRPCEYAEKLDAESGKTWLHLGALQQIQTSVNTVDNGRDLWLTIRSRNVFTDRIQLMLATHSVDLSLYPSYETVAVPEVAGYFIFERDHHIQCVEGLVFETQISFPVTSEAIEVDFFFTYDYPPGIFGMLGSLNSLGDSTALRVFERTETKAWYITQEDQCFDEETRHTTEERSFAFIAGESRGLEVPQTRCFISYAYSNPTGVPSSHPSLAPTLNNDAVCGACLADGEYIFRSTGACDPYGEGVSWDFCGVRGNVQDEFHFWMEDGVCYPGVFGEACGSLSAHPTSLPSAEPSGVPSCQPSSEPSSQPTILPSSAPTSLPTELGSFDVVPELECQSQCGETHTTNDTCLYVTLWDSFGDGWVNGSAFYYWAQIRGEDTNVVNETLDCGCPVMAGCIHPSELNVDQLFHMTVVAMDSEGVAYVPEYAWEVHWTVQVVEDGVWKEKYYGGYNSSFVFEYDRASESYSLDSWSNLWTFPEYCNDCVETAAKGDAFSYSEYLSDVVQRSNSSVGDFGVSGAPDYLTTAWYITDTSKTVLHAYSEPFCGGDQPSVVPTSLYSAVPSLHPSGVPSAFQPVSPPVELQSLPATYDMLLHEDMNHIWLEIGYTILNDYEWTDVTTSVQNFNANGDGDKNVSIFIGLPDYGGPTYEDGFPLVPKLRERAERQVDGSFKFSAKLVQANDSFCSKEWYIPEHVENIQVGWMAVEEGVYNVSGSMFVIDSGLITRDNSVPVSEDTPVLYHHVVTFNFTSGCDSLNPDRPCEYAEKLDAESGKTWLHLGALQQIQTSVNTVDNGRDLWLTIRSRNVFTDRIQLMLATHSVDLSLYPSYETVAVPEVAGYFIFERDHHIQCVEGLVFETQISFPVTSEAIEVDFFFTYDYPPGIFGMLGSLNSLGDSTALRVFERTETKAWYITQEDQCFDEETRHTTEERSFAFIAGESRGLEVPQTRCFISYAYSNPTGVPSSHPSLAPTLNNDAVCGACLADGEYIFRSTGACDPYGEGVSWDFCGVRGNVQDEFHFWMEDGVCYPGVFGEACGSLSAHPTSLPSAEPSGVPSCQPSSEPSSQPTILPSSAPTSLPTELGSFDVVPELECQSQCGETQTTNDTCLYVTLWDSFGDGWVNGSAFYYWAQIRGEDTNVVNETLDCGCPVMAGCIHPSELNVDQLFHMTVVAMDSEGVAYVPEYAWEVHWTVQVVEDGVWKEKYYGGYNSSFVFEYDRASESYSLDSWSNLWTFPEYCNDCVETAAKGDAFSYSEYLSDVVQRSNSSVGDFGVSGAPDYLTTAWYITDTSKTVLHAYSEPFCGGDQPSVVPTSLYSAVPSLHPSGVPSAFQPVSPPVELQSLPATYDMLLHEDMNHIWLEIGYTILNDYEWTDVTTSVQNFNANGDGDKNVSIFIGLPDYGGPTYEDGFPLVPKLRERAERQVDGSFKFSAKLVQANDSFCSKEWYIPEHVENIQVGWMAVEEGVYNVSGSMFVIDSGLITRDNSVPVSEDTPVLYHHVVTFNFTSGCDSLNPDRPCEYAEKLDAESGKTWLHLGALQQIQTSVNTVDNGRDLWLTIRSRNVFTDRIQLMLATHSVDLSLYPSYETVAVPEVAGYFIFERDHHIQCVEGLVFETQISFPVTSEAIEVDFFFTYDYPPGIFGMLGSLNSLGDSTALRVFERTETKAWYITQEDQCFDEETRHTTEERSFAFIAGESRGLEVPQTRCFISYAYSNPTGVPSSHPSLAPTLNNDAVCGACLADGEYIFRSTGACDPYGEGVSWDFCGVRGNVQDEFHFWMEDGVCYPGVFGEACGSLSAHPTSLPSAEPSGVPSCQPSSEPSSQPTILPSSAPTSLPTELGSFDVVPELECQSQCGETQTTNDTCLYVTLWDSFGDGWVNGSTFYYWAQIRGEDTNVVNETLDCGCPVMAGYIHPSELNVDQLFHMTVVALDSEGVAYVPEYAWEVHWTVQVVEDGVWKEKYYGGYNSSFVFEYDRASESYSLESWSNLWTFPEHCNDCVETAAKGDAFSYSEYLSDVVQRSNSSVGDFGVSGAPDYLTTAWYITDTSKTVLHAYSEPFCGGDQPSVVPTSLYSVAPSSTSYPSLVPTLNYDAVCGACLADGEYIFRATGACDSLGEGVSWNFCGVRGNIQKEFHFWMKGGVCYPGVYGEACGSLSAHPTSLPSSGPTMHPSHLLGIDLVKTEAGSVNGKSVAFSRHVTVSVVGIFLTGVVVAILVNFMKSSRRQSVTKKELRLKELGSEQEQCKLSICLDIADSHEVGGKQLYDSTDLQQPTIAGTFMEEDLSVFSSDVFS